MLSATRAVCGCGDVYIEIVPVVRDDGGSVDLLHMERREVRAGALGIVQLEANVAWPLVRAWVADLDVLVDRVSLVNLDVVGKLSAVGFQSVQQARVLFLQPVDLIF